MQQHNSRKRKALTSVRLAETAGDADNANDHKTATATKRLCTEETKDASVSCGLSLSSFAATPHDDSVLVKQSAKVWAELQRWKQCFWPDRDIMWPKLFAMLRRVLWSPSSFRPHVDPFFLMLFGLATDPANAGAQAQAQAQQHQVSDVWKLRQLAIWFTRTTWLFRNHGSSSGGGGARFAFHCMPADMVLYKWRSCLAGRIRDNSNKLQDLLRPALLLEQPTVNTCSARLPLFDSWSAIAVEQDQAQHDSLLTSFATAAAAVVAAASPNPLQNSWASILLEQTPAGAQGVWSVEWQQLTTHLGLCVTRSTDVQRVAAEDIDLYGSLSDPCHTASAPADDALLREPVVQVRLCGNAQLRRLCLLHGTFVDFVHIWHRPPVASR